MYSVKENSRQVISHGVALFLPYFCSSFNNKKCFVQTITYFKIVLHFFPLISVLGFVLRNNQTQTQAEH